jgi:hypothetical protein
MIKQTYSSIVFLIVFLALMIASPSANLTAQTTEERSSVTTTRTTTEAQPAQEQSSVTISTRSTNSSTGAQPAQAQSSATSSTRSTTVAQAGGEHRCIGNCRGQSDRSMDECNAPGHPHHHKCEEWSRDREKDCLEKCYRE